MCVVHIYIENSSLSMDYGYLVFCIFLFFILGLGKGINSGSAGSNCDAYLQLSVTVLAAFCRVPEIASSEDMVSKIPLILELMPKE